MNGYTATKEETDKSKPESKPVSCPESLSQCKSSESSESTNTDMYGNALWFLGLSRGTVSHIF